MVILEELHSRRGGGAEQGALDFHPGEVGGVHHAPLGMPALAREVVPERRGVARELRSQLDQLPHAPRSFSDGDAHRFLATQSRAGHERVVDVLLVAVLWAEDGAIPPWAYAVLLSDRLRLASRATDPCLAACTAKESPAIPEPSTR